MILTDATANTKLATNFILTGLGAGNLITKLCPKRICIYALNSMATGIFTSNELFYVDVDPNEMLFKRFGCFDVGIQCGGWGRVIMEISVEERKKIVT
ncbi:MAG: hypothetical protein ACXAC2_18075 [Candidatus Kariarchaeaceae archaeon]